MNSPLLNFQLVESNNVPSKAINTAKVFPFKPAANTEFLPVAANAYALAGFKSDAEQDDRKLLDYLLLGVLSMAIHTSVVDYFNNAHVAQQELIEPVKVPPKVQISLLRPQPKPIIQPPPPPVKVQPQPKAVPKAVPLKPKPKVKPKPVEKTISPPPIQPTVPALDSKAPVIPAPPVAQPAPKPPVEEKVTEPRAGADYLNNPSPEYPDIAMDRGLEGKVLMKVHVQPNGKPDSVNVIKSSGHSILDDAAVKTVKQWSFVPAMRGKTPIAGWVTVPIAFNLQN